MYSFVSGRRDCVDTHKLKALAFDLDGTLTQHKTKLEKKHQQVLDRLGREYRLLMLGAGECSRIFLQMNRYPIDIIGNYGMQYGQYNRITKNLDMQFNISLPCDRKSVILKLTELRKVLGLTQYSGASVEFHNSGCITFPLLGTETALDTKLAFDPDRKIRRAMYAEVVKAFPEYTVFIGGSSSFDLAPRPYNKYYALDIFCRNEKLSHDNVLYVGDDYGLGGNDEAVYQSDFPFLTIDDYTMFPELMNSHFPAGL